MSATPCLVFREPAMGDRYRCAACGGTRAEHEGRAAPWTEAHRREALRRTYEIAAQMAASRPAAAGYLCTSTGVDTELRWRGELGDPAASGLDAARIDREVRRVRDFAEGRLVREAWDRWEVVTPGGGREVDFVDHGHAYRRVMASNKSNREIGASGRYRLVRVRVTRIRRVQP